LSLLQMIVPAAMYYTASWTFLGCVFLFEAKSENLVQTSIPDINRINVLSTLAALSIIVTTLAIPVNLTIGSRTVHINEMLAPAFTSLFCLGSFIISFTIPSGIQEKAKKI
jgi:hypothetical protein